jgi:hypothetical protein
MIATRSPDAIISDPETPYDLLLDELPRLSLSNVQTKAIPCKICRDPAAFFDVVDFNKTAGFYPWGPSGVTVRYYRCDTCGFLFTPLCDNWSVADVRHRIYNEDYIRIDGEYPLIRPQRTAKHIASMLAGFEDLRILDYGSGTGAFAESMAELGFRHVVSYDPLSQPARPSGQFDLITCIEVIEHSPTPLETLADMHSFLADQGCIFLGEALQPPDIQTIRCNWWYCMPRNGHVSMFTDQTLSRMADLTGMLFHRGVGIHAFSTPHFGPISELATRISPAIFTSRLGAPNEGFSEVWHGIEHFSGIPTRWTATSSVTWRIIVPPGHPRMVQISVPFVLQGRPGFAAQSSISIRNQSGDLQMRGNVLVGEASPVAPGEAVVILRTPEPKSPADLSGAPDQRKLGLAIPVVTS